MKQLTKLKEHVYWDGNKVVYPIRKNIKKPFSLKDNVDWRNLFIGNKGVTFFMLFVLIMAGFYAHDTKECRELITHPCQICDSMRESAKNAGCTEEYQKLGLCFNFNESIIESSKTNLSFLLQ